MKFTSDHNLSLFLEFAVQAATCSSSLRTLHIQWMGSSATDGDKFAQSLADDDFDGLQSLTIANEYFWFKGGRDGCVDSLVTIIARQ